MTASPLENVKLSLVQCIDDLMEMKRWAGERRPGPLCYDTETGGLSPEKDSLRLIQLGDEQRGWAVPFMMWGGGAVELLDKYQGRLGAFNQPFDNRFLSLHAGWQPPWHKIDDGLTAAHLIDPLRPRGLKALSDRLVDRRASAGQQALHDGMRKQGWTWATVPVAFQPYWVYAALDPVLTAHVLKLLLAQVRLRSLEGVYDFELAVSRVVTQMMLRGLRVDVQYVVGKLAQLRQFAARSREWMQQQHHIASPMSGMQIAAALEAMGQEITHHTEHGFPEMSKETLAWYQANAVSPEASELCRQVLAVRHAEKMAGTYLENLLDLRDHDDIVHASIWPLGARSGRMSITDPALQTLPRDDLVVRGAFIPREGHVLISCDFDQIEMRLAAHFSCDQGLINAFKAADENGTDFFSEVASEIFHERIMKKDRRRQMVKNMGYARIYGAGLAKMAVTAGVTEQQLKPVFDSFNARYPGLNAMTNRLVAEAAAYEKPGVKTPMGRFLPCETGKEYVVTNYLIQGHAAELLKQAMLSLDAAGFGDMMLLPVHDELIFEVPEQDAQPAAAEIKRIMENRDGYAVPVTCVPKIMQERWEGK